MSSPRGSSRRYKQDEKDNAVRLVRTLPHAVKTSAMAMSGAAMVATNGCAGQLFWSFVLPP